MTYLDKQMDTRIRTDEFDQINKLIEKHPDIYSSQAHFVRSAIIKELRRWKNGLLQDEETSPNGNNQDVQQ